MWSNFSQSSVEEETIGNVFCKTGLFKVWCDEMVTECPQVQAFVQNKKIVIAINKSIILLEDENVAKCSFLCFNSKIDYLSITQTGNLIICALSDGEIHGVFIKGVPVFRLSINEDDIGKGKTFVGVQHVNNSFYITCCNGSIYRISNIDEIRLETCINMFLKENETLPLDETIMDAAFIEKLTKTKSLNDLTSINLVPNSYECTNLFENYVAVAGTNCFLRFQSMLTDIKVIIPEHYEGIKSIYNFENFLVALTNSGHLIEICIETKSVIHWSCYDGFRVDQLIVMENNSDSIELLMLTKPDDDEKRLMKIVDFPSFKCCYELEMPKNTWLVNQPKCSVNLYYLSSSNVNNQHYPQEIEMKIVSETQPSERLKKFIQKGHLEEAEDFGKKFGLNLQPVYEAKAKRLLSDVNSTKEDNIDLLAEKFKELCTVFKLIENKDFFVKIRSCKIPNRRFLALYLNEILKIVKIEIYEKDVFDIEEQLLRLETLNIIDPYECNLEWQKFVYHPNVAQVCATFFQTDMTTACLIWKRHSAAIITHVNEKTILKVLNLIPANVEPFNLIQWLRHFIPSITLTFPNIMPTVIEWSIQKTNSLDNLKDWPDVGYEFALKVVNIFNDIPFLHSHVCRQHINGVEKLQKMVNALKDLSTLKESYNLIFSLSSYIKNSFDETAFSILQRVQITNLKRIVNNFLYPIYMEKGETPVISITKYIHYLVSNRKNLSSWLERATVLIEILPNEENKLKCGLLILKAAPVPWSEQLYPIIKLRNSTHPLAAEINTEYEIQITKLMKSKYGVASDATDNNMKLVFRIVKVCLPEMIQDIKDLTKSMPEIQSSVNFYCCYELARVGNIEMAIKFFNSLEERQKCECTEKIINIFQEILDDSDCDSSKENLYEYLKHVIPYSKQSDQNLLIDIKNVLTLKIKFNLTVSIDRLKDRFVREDLLGKQINLLSKNITQNKELVNNIWSEIWELTKALKLEQTHGVLEVARLFQNIYLSCSLAYHTIELVDVTRLNCEHFIDLSVLLIAQHIDLVQKGQLKKTEPMVYPLAYNLLVKCIPFNKILQPDIFELLKWIRIVSSCYKLSAIKDFFGDEENISELILAELKENSNKPITNSDLNKRHSMTIFDEIIPNTNSPKKKVTSDFSSVSNCISLALLVVLEELNPNTGAFKRLRECIIFAKLSTDIQEKFYRSFEHLIKSKQHSTWNTLAIYILEYQKNVTTQIISADFYSMQLKKMFKYLLLQKEPNFIDLFGMLVSDTAPKLFLESLECDIKNDQQKINFLILSEMYFTHCEDSIKVKAILESRKKHYYATELCKEDPSLKTKSDIENVLMSQLSSELQHRILSVKLLEKISRDFELDFQQLLISQVITILQRQEPVFELKTDEFGLEIIVMKSNVEDIKKQCKSYINEIRNNELLATSLLQFIGESNFYFYELYLCVIEILSYIGGLPKEMEIWTSILIFLKHKMITKRLNRPGQMEIDWWLKSHNDVSVLPKIAKYRLPFMPLVQQPLKDILDNEVNVDNCEKWFPLIKMHTIMQGASSQEEIEKMQSYFCMSAVKNSISEYKTYNDTDFWHLRPTNNAFLQSILRLVKHVSSPSKVLLILYFVTNHAPNGADQVEAAFECYKFAMDHKDTILFQGKTNNVIVNIKRKYPILKTQHLLHLYGLIDDILLEKAENPQELIYDLYHLDIILNPTKPDINKLANEISTLHQLDFDMLQVSLLQKWLLFNSDSETSDLEDTFFEDTNQSDSIDSNVNSEFVFRAYYILSSWESDKAMQFLVSHIFPLDGCTNTCKQLQMYECFSQLVKDSSDATYIDILNQKKYINIKCVHGLKQLGCNFPVDKFESYDKISILKKVWQSHATNPIALEVMSNICLGFDICIPKIWNSILKQMVHLHMINELNALVDTLSCKPEILHTEGLAKAWEYVLKVPFKKANRSKSDEQEEKLSKTLFKIQSCPVISKINITEIAEDCIRLDRPHLAAILIGFCFKENNRKYIKSIVKPHVNENLKKYVTDLEEHGILHTTINFVLKELYT